MTDHEWIPDAVKSLADKIEIGKAIGDKLLSLQPVWEILKHRAEELDADGKLSERLAKLPDSWRLDTHEAGTLGTSLPDRALAAYYSAVVIKLGLGRPAVTKSHIAEHVDSLRAAAAQCLVAIPACDGALARSLRTSAEYMDELADSIERGYAKSTDCLMRSSGERNDNNIRATIRGLAHVNHSIFGEFLYGTLASLSESLLGEKVSEETIRSWCKGCEQATSYWHPL